MGHKVTVLCCAFEGAPPEEVIDGIRIIRRGSRNTFNFIVPFQYRKLRREGFDVVVDDINKIPFYTPLFVREPLVGLSHHFFGTSIFREAGSIAGGYVYFSEKMVDYIYKGIPFLVVSQSTLDEFVARGFRREDFTLALNSIDHERLHPTGVPDTPYPSIAYFGRLKRYKSIDHILRAFVQVRRELPDAQLIIIGRGDFQPELARIATELGIADVTRFTGFVSDEEKLRLLQEAWVVVNPSMKEGWGIVNVEANACGTPTIAADSPGLRDSVREDYNGFLYPYGDVDALATKLLLLLRDTELRERLGRNAIDFARSITWDDTASATVQVLQTAVEQRRRKKN